MRTTALIVAAGRGIRMGTDKNKLLLKIGKKTILEHTLEKFVNSNLIDEIIVAASKDDIKKIEEICKKYQKNIRVTEGGKNRTKSVFNGLKAIGTSCDIVLIHDGARPFVSENIIKCCIDNVNRYGSAITAISVTDTLKKADDHFMIISSLERSELFSIQTPQGFIFKDILAAYNKLQNDENFSDDSSVYEKYFGHPYISMGESSNIKITYNKDLAFFKEENMIRCGMGYDSHKFSEGRKLILGGVEIPFEKGLLGHSDADALIHAVIDSMLSAAGCSDIGSNFPDTSPEFKNIQSIKLLEKTNDIIALKGLSVSNISCIIICESPKLEKYLPIMRKNISDVLNCNIECIGISAKTNEGMGFTGRKEGIAVFANCLLGAK